MRLLLLAALVLPITLACAGGAPDGAPSTPPPAAAKGPAELLSGGAAVIPAAFKGVVPGMTRAEATQRLPALANQSWFKDPEWGELMFAVDIDESSGLVDRVYVNLPAADAESAVSAAWGPPTRAKGPYTAFEKLLWWNAAAGVRANLGNALVDTRPLEFTAYQPVSTMLGAQGPSFAFVGTEGVMGRDVTALGGQFGDRLVCSYDEGGKNLDVPWSKLAVKFPPDADHDYFLELPATEYGDYWTRVHLDFNDAGAVTRMRFSIPFEGNAAHRDATMALLKAKFGTEGEAVQELGKTRTRLAEKPLDVRMGVDSLGDAVEITVEAAGGKGRPVAGGRPGQGRPGKAGEAKGGRPGVAGGAGRPGQR